MHDPRVKFVTTASVCWIAPSTLMYKQLKYNQINDKKTETNDKKFKKKKKIQVCESNQKEDTVEKNETKKKRKLPVQ